MTDNGLRSGCMARINARVILIALAPLVLLEISLGLFESQLSGDIAQSKTVQTDIHDFLTDNQDPTILIVGNSLVGEAIDAEALVSSLDFDAQVFKAVPDGTNIWEWYCILSNVSRQGSAMPDIIVLAFARDRLSDQSPLDVARSFGYLCGMENIAEISAFAPVSLEDTLQALVVKTSSTYRLRNRIRNNLLNLLVPNYTDALQRINSANRSRTSTRQVAPSQSRANSTYLATRDLSSRDAFSGSHFLFVAMPILDRYEVNDSLCSELTQANSSLVDMRGLAELQWDDYRDQLHLNESGRKKFTRAFADVLSVKFPNGEKDSSSIFSCESQ